MRMDSGVAMARQRSVGEAGDARRRDLTRGGRTELKGGDDGAGVDLRDLAVDAELGAFGTTGVRASSRRAVSRTMCASSDLEEKG